MGGIWQSIVSTFQGQGLNAVSMAIYGSIAAIFAATAWIWSKHPVRWTLVLVTVAVILLAFSYRGTIPARDDLDPDLPDVFKPPYFAWWVLALSLATVYLLVHLVWVWIRTHRAGEGEASGEPARFPDLEAAWEEIQIRLSHARYDVGQQKVFLLLATDEATAASMIESAGLQLFAQAPVDENAPIHAYATADGLFLSCAGASAWGCGDEEGTERLVVLCRKILALNPEQPVLRGVAVLYPMKEAASAELLQGAGALRNDLQTVRAELTVRCPTLAVFCLREPYAGFEEFARRVPSNVRIRRCGFSVPSMQRFDRAAAMKGLGWLVQWFSTWSLKLMTDEFHDTQGNNKLVTMNAQLWRDLPSLCHLVEVSFSTHAQAEPILVRGCYFVVCEPEPEARAFAAGLINGKSSKMIADAVHTSWSRDAGAGDRGYRRTALGLALATAMVVLPVWYTGIIQRLEVHSQHPLWLWLAWGCLGALAMVWAAGLSYQWLGRKQPAKPTRGS